MFIRSITLPACGLVLALLLPTTNGIARAGGISSEGTPPTDGPAARANQSPVVRTLAPPDWETLSLARAVDLWRTGDVAGAAALLETIDVGLESTFDQADRAAFLLSMACIQMNDTDAFLRVAGRAGAEKGSAWRRWIHYCLLLASDEPDRLLRSTRSEGPLYSIVLYQAARDREAAGFDATPEWKQLAGQKAHNALEADLVAGALLKLVEAQLERGESVDKLLDRVPGNSSLVPDAEYIRGLVALNEGDSGTARRILSRIPVDFPVYENRRDVALALGAIESDQANWSGALKYFESAESFWLEDYEGLERLEEEAKLDDIWTDWFKQQRWREEIRFSPEAVLDLLTGITETALDLTDGRRPDAGPENDLSEKLLPEPLPAATGALWDSTGLLVRFGPSPDEWKTVRQLRDDCSRKSADLARHNRMVSDRERELKRRAAYLQTGFEKAGDSRSELAGAAARLEMFLARLDEAILKLEAARDRSLRDIAVRTRNMAEQIRKELLFMQALRHFHVEGPRNTRTASFPPGVLTPAEILNLEDSLAVETATFVETFAAYYPVVINRSFDTVWEPRLTGDSRSLYAAILAGLDRASGIGIGIDSTLSGYRNDPELAAAKAQRDILAAELDSLRVLESHTRRQIAVAVAARGRLSLENEREAIDYHLTDTGYELAVKAAANTKTAADSAAVVSSRALAMDRLETFLSRYADSRARGESRFRLADLTLMQARDDFQARMAGFIGDKPSADQLEDRSLAPFVDYAPVVALYRSILDEDPEFPHQDAVLFNLGMILSDDGQPEASDILLQLVTRYPGSPNCQEAWLRLGSDRFDREDFAGCTEYFEHAVSGDDPSFTAIALYKMGWARFDLDQFEESTDVFRRLVDLYESYPRLVETMDLRGEAREYLVHSLARSGGAATFRRYFDGLGGRDYESGILISLGRVMRGVSLYEEAVACDRLWLERYPLEPEALEITESLVSTYKQWNKPVLARDTKLAEATRFMRGSPWYEANGDKELRTAGELFARSAYRETATFYHRRARQDNGAADWQLASTHYDFYLDHWPASEDSREIHFFAGETAGRLNDFSGALAHFTAAADNKSDSLAVAATWQRLALSDAWYRSSVPKNETTGADSLAIGLLRTAREFVKVFPNDKRNADVVWRRANVAYAHGWYGDAAETYLMLGSRFPADPRATQAIRLCGDARYQSGEYAAAGDAYELAQSRAIASGEDSVVTALQTTIPLCYYKHAESVAAADQKHGEEKAALLFVSVAQRWPEFKHADLALYRAGLGFAAGNKHSESTGVWEQLLLLFPQSEYARDSAIQVALAHDKTGDKQKAAVAYERFSRLYPDDPEASESLLKAADLLDEDGDNGGAERMRTVFLSRFPGEKEAVMEIRAVRAEKQLAGVAAGTTTLASLLDGTSKGDLRKYLDLASKDPELASPLILARVDFLKAEEALPEYRSIELTQPLPTSIELKKKKMEDLLEMYARCAGHGITEYSRAAAFRIGQLLVLFGDALHDSERPGGLSDDDLLAYEEVLDEQSWEFYDRGEKTWTELLQQTDQTGEDPGGWIALAREFLWPRLAWRFLYRPEMDYPLVAARPPEEIGAN